MRMESEAIHDDVSLNPRRWDVVARQLDLLLLSVPSPAAPFDSSGTSWAELPKSLAAAGFLLQGMPAQCVPDVRYDRVHDDLYSWPPDKLKALDHALTTRSIRVMQRKPLSRRVLFELVHPDGTRFDSTLGFSEPWQLENMFPFQVYSALTSSSLRTMNLESLVPLLRDANLTTGQLPWVSLPSKLWASSQYLSGLSRICLPPIVNGKVPADTPTPATNWKKDQRIALQRALDAGVLKVLPRPSGRQVIFEVLEADGSLRDDDLGFSQQWKDDVTALSLKDKKPSKKKSIRDLSHGQATVNTPGIPWPASTPTAETPQAVQRPPVIPNETMQRKQKAIDGYAKLLRSQGLLIDSSDGPGWVYVPQMLATRRVHVSGLPRLCLPIVKDDDVIANSDPRQWSNAALEAFLRAYQNGSIQVSGTELGERVLYRVPEIDGQITNDILNFSEKWCKDYLDPPNFSALSPSDYVIEMWLDMLESVGIPCHDYRGRRRIQWLQLPVMLARRQLYVSGCPPECFPRVEDDMVVELSSPYFYDENQIRLMHQVFSSRKVSLRTRPRHRNVLFALEEGTQVTDFTCGFTPHWIKTNFQGAAITSPNTSASQQQPNGQGARGSSSSNGISLRTPTTQPTGRPTRAQSSSHGPTKTSAASTSNGRAGAGASTQYSNMQPTGSFLNNPLHRHLARQRRASESVLAKKANQTQMRSSLPSPASSGQATPPPNVYEDDMSSSLKIIIPAFKLRSLSSTALSAPQQSSVFAPYSAVTPVTFHHPPHLATPRAPPSGTPRHMVPVRRSLAKPQSHGPSKAKEPESASPTTSENEDYPGAFGLRSSLSPRMPPLNTLPSPLPATPVPTFLPKPGGNLIWDEGRASWELTISEVWTPSDWKRLLPVFPARVLWNSAQKVWMCEPSKALTAPCTQGIGLSQEVIDAWKASVRGEGSEAVEEGLSIIWHRWRQSWGLFE